MNFINEFKKGQKGGNKGLSMGEGLANVSKAVNGVQKTRIFGIAGASKSGKSTFADYAFVIQPYMQAITNKLDVEWIYFSFELSRISKEFDFITYFLHLDYGIDKIQLDEGQTCTYGNETKNYIYLSPDYLRGRIQDDNGEIIKVKDTILEAMKITYEKRIIGEFDEQGNQLKPGVITFCTGRDNPTGISKFIKKFAEKRGVFIKSDDSVYARTTGYKQHNDNKQVIIVIDHVRKLILEQSFQMKQNVDKMLEYMCEIRDICNYTFVPLIHTNRSISNIESIKFAKDELYPTSDDIKDTSNMSEDCDYLFTIFNPNEDKFKLQKHFGVDIRDSKGNPLYLNMRTIHLVESRHCIYPQHFRTIMRGNLKSFEQLNIK
jgi:hypothetical protein